MENCEAPSIVISWTFSQSVDPSICLSIQPNLIEYNLISSI
jgi:hypothetical protein